MESYGDRALQHALQLAKPRRSGSPGEAKARSYISGQLRSLGYKVSEEPFTFQSIGESQWRRYLVGLALLTILIGLAAWAEMRLACTILGVGILIYGLGGGVFNRQQLRQALEGKSIESTNLFSTMPGPSCFGPRLLFCAHYDSKSQNASLRGRIFMITGTIFLAFILAMSTILLMFWAPFPNRAPTWIAGSLLALVLLLFSLKTTNNSPGAIDNAAAVGILLELAERLRLKGAPPGREIAFLFSGAEEEGLMGAMSFMREHVGALTERSHQVVNLDIVGNDSTLYVWRSGKISKGIEKDLLRNAKEIQTPLRRMPIVLGAAADHLPFASAKIPAVTLTSPFGVLGRVHTPADTLDLLNKKSLGRIVRLLEATAVSQEKTISV